MTEIDYCLGKTAYDTLTRHTLYVLLVIHRIKSLFFPPIAVAPFESFQSAIHNFDVFLLLFRTSGNMFEVLPL